MRREPKLSSDNELDLKFIAMFTVGFVVISVIILAAGYVLLSLLGVLGQGQAEAVNNTTATPDASGRPTYIVIGVTPDPLPSAEPTIFVTPEPTATPSPTPTPSPYKVVCQQDQTDAGSMRYNITFTMKSDSLPIDLTQAKLRIWDDWGATYCDYGYDEIMYWMDGWWRNSDKNKILEPNGESLTIQVDARSLNIPLDRDTRIGFFLGDTQLTMAPLPSFQNNADLGEVQDPGNNLNDYTGTEGGSGTGNDPWVSDSFDPSAYGDIDWSQYFN